MYLGIIFISVLFLMNLGLSLMVIEKFPSASVKPTNHSKKA